MMGFWDLISFSLSNIWAQKLRTFLTLSAITIGGLLVFLLPSLGLGVARELGNQFDSKSLNDISIQPKYEDIKVDFTKTDLAGPKLLKKIQIKDIEEIGKNPNVKGVKEVSFPLRPNRIHFDSLNKDMTAEGFDFTGSKGGVNYYIPPTQFNLLPLDLPAEEYGLEVVSGRFLNASDKEKPNIVINKVITDGLKVDKPEDLVGETLTLTFVQKPEKGPEESLSTTLSEVKQYRMNIVGVIKPKDNNSFNEEVATPSISLPFNQAWQIIQWQEAKNKEFAKDYTFDSVEVVASTNEAVTALAQEFEDKGFRTHSSIDTIKEFQKGVQIALSILASVGLIALFVGALNIINTLMMAVTERTKEIGILRSLGASRATIRRLFLVESAVIAFLGALFGIFWGWVISLIANSVITRYMKSMGAESAGVPLPQSFFDYSPQLILGVLAFITLIGLIAGIAPAIRASRLNVVDSLRYE